MQNQFTIKSCLAALGLALAAQTSLQAQNFTPIALTPSSFTANMVIPTNWTYKLNAQSVTVTIDHGPILQTDTAAGFPTYYSLDSGDTFFEVGLDRASATTLTYGIPAGGSLLTNTTFHSHVYQLPYWTNYNSNCICIGPYTNGDTYNSQPLTGGPYVGQNYYTNVNLTLNNTTPLTALSLLTTSGGPFFNSVIISYADGTTQGPVNFAIPNWFVNASTYIFTNATTPVQNSPTASFAFTCNARCNPSENNNNFTISSGVTSGTRLWSVDIALSDTSSYPTNLSFSSSYANTGTTASSIICAVSGSVNPADNTGVNAPPNTTILTGPFSPIAVSGFNAGFVVANSPQTLAGLYPLTATMDHGTNLSLGANTFFEKGWDQAQPTNGFPVHGSTITSGAFPNRSYQMAATYAGPMCILIDTNHQLVNITPANTNLAYTGFSLLTAGASINSGNKMTNYIILQHADGVNESNLFIGYDWFETTVPAAWSCAERCNIGASNSTTGREVANLEAVNANGSPPCLFDSEFPMQDGSPVTNMLLGYLQAPSASSTTYILAVSATTNYIPVQTGTYTAAQNVYPGQSAVFSITVPVGTLPTYQWQVTDGVTFTNNLANGATSTGSFLSGVFTNTLTISNVSSADVNFYTCLVSNVLPSTANSTNAPLTLRVSTATNVVQRSDAISDFFGSGYSPGEAFPSPVGLTLNYAIDGTDQQYLNWGASGGDTAFQGPVGLIVHPGAGPTVVSAVRFIVPVNAPICDPADFSLDGSFDGTHWANIVPDEPLALPDERNAAQTTAVNITNQVLQEVDFPNTNTYNYYRVTVQNVKNNAPGVTANSMQIGEIQLLGSLAPVAPEFFVEPFPTTQTLRAGGSVTWTALATGAGPITYQWYEVTGAGVSMISGATNTTYTLTNASTAMINNLYYSIASNPYGSNSSFLVKLNVTTSTVSQYVTNVLADNPIAFLRLDEATNTPPTFGNDGTIAYDIIGGHDGIYSNTVLQANPPGSYSTNDPTELPALFGTIIDPDTTANPQPSPTLPQDNYVGGLSGINFGTPTNTTTNFSVEAWVYLNANTVGGAGLVAEGWGSGEEFAIDMGGTSNAFRFYFRTAGTNSITVSPNVAPSNSIWYYVAGVLNEQPNVVTATYTNYVANEYLYVNGLLAATTQTVFSNAPGVLNTNTPISIGARPSSGGTNLNFQLDGAMANVAIYNYALSSNQILNHYNATAQSPGILTQPTPLVQNMQIGATGPPWYVAVFGSEPILYQWYEVTTNGSAVSTNLVFNATNATFTVSNASTLASYFCTASNPYGSTNSIFVTANVMSPTSEYVSTVVADAPIAFFRLDEGPDNGAGNDGVTAFDSFGAHNGVYSNTLLQVSSYSANDPDNFAAEFGLYTDQTLATPAIADNYVGGINGVNFFSPTNTDSSLSIETWVNLHANVASAGVVTKGYGNGGEEFALDTDGTGDDFRFYFRNAGGASYTVSPNVAPTPGIWYHVVAVLYESNNVAYEYIYTNGILGGTTTTTFTNPPGLLSNDIAAVTIGARQSATGTNFNLQLNGVEANVAIYNYPLSAAQVLNHYLASGIAPVFTVMPTNLTVLVGQSAPAVFYSSAFGTSNAFSPMVYQWSYNGQNLVDGPSPTGTGAIISGSTTPKLTISGFTINDNGDFFTVTITNNYGAINASAQLTVAQGPPVVAVDVLPTYTVFAGNPAVLSASFTGSVPFTYQWTYNGHSLVNGARISGATNDVLVINPTVLADSGTYQLNVSNIFGPSQSSQTVLTVLPYLTLNGFGAGWSLNSGGTGTYTSAGYPSTDTLELTDGGVNEARSSFFSNTVYVGAFQASYTYTDVNGNGANADGACFVLQNDPRGQAALGASGGTMGYGPTTGVGITPSVALEFDLYQNNLVGAAFGEDGSIADGAFLNTYPVALNFGDPINVTVTYLGGVVTVFLQDTINTNQTFTTSANVNIPAVLGTNMAYVGFTGGDGGTTSTQTIGNFQFLPLPDLTAQASGANIVLSWPTGTGVFQLESNSNLGNTNGWVNVNTQPVVANGENQVTVPRSAGPEFYRLQLP